MKVRPGRPADADGSPWLLSKEVIMTLPTTKGHAMEDTITYDSVSEEYHLDPDAFTAYCHENNISELDCEDQVRNFEDAFMGGFESEAAFAEHWYELTYPDASIPSIISGCIDWQQVWDRNLRHDFSESLGYFFRQI
jgi:hypothetical protein